MPKGVIDSTKESTTEFLLNRHTAKLPSNWLNISADLSIGQWHFFWQWEAVMQKLLGDQSDEKISEYWMFIPKQHIHIMLCEPWEKTRQEGAENSKSLRCWGVFRRAFFWIEHCYCTLEFTMAMVTCTSLDMSIIHHGRKRGTWGPNLPWEL